MIRALIRGAGPEATPVVLRAVEAQIVPVDQVRVVGSWREGAGPPVELLWLLDEGVVPEPGALAALLEAGRRIGAPAVVAGVVSGPAGGLDHASEPIAETRRLGRVMACAERGDLALCGARGGSLLVSREVLALAPLPDPGGELAWTAAVARQAQVVLATGSRATRHGRPARRGALARARELTRLLAAVDPRDHAWLLANLAERLITAPPADGGGGWGGAGRRARRA